MTAPPKRLVVALSHDSVTTKKYKERNSKKNLKNLYKAKFIKIEECHTQTFNVEEVIRYSSCQNSVLDMSIK
jgi:hypothetical protein